MKKTMAVLIGAGLLVLLVLFSSTYAVRYHELAIKTRFGQIGDDSVQPEAGLHFRLPLFAEHVQKYDTRLQLLESPLRTVATADDQQVMVRAYLLWKVDAEEAVKFYESFNSIVNANDLLKDRLNTALEQRIKTYAFNALVGEQSRLPDAEAAVLADLASLTDRGVDPVSVGISQVVLPAKTTGAVLNRMQVSRNALAAAEREKGMAEAAGIESEANTIVNKLLAFANQRAEEIRAAADETAAEYLAEMQEDVALAVFLLWLDTLQASLQENTTLFFTNEFAPWHMLNSTDLGDAGPIPQPRQTYTGPVAADRPHDDQPKAEAQTDQTPHAAEGEGS
ncbi:MAG: SPFH domain-containing protein [Phycisphaerales bacterium]